MKELRDLNDDPFCKSPPVPAVERIWHIPAIQGQILVLASKSATPLKMFPRLSEALPETRWCDVVGLADYRR